MISCHDISYHLHSLRPEVSSNEQFIKKHGKNEILIFFEMNMVAKSLSITNNGKNARLQMT